MIINDLINNKLVLIDCAFKNKDEAIGSLSSLLENNRVINSREDFISAVKERESLTTTAIDFGIAIPHARSECVVRPGIAAGRSKEFIWDANTNQSVSLIFLLAVPERIEYPEYMKILASISRMLVHRRFRNQLLEARNVDEFISTISNGECYLVNGNNSQNT